MSGKRAQALGADWPLLPSAPPSSGNALHPASLVHSSLSANQVKIQQHTLLVAKQLLIELGPLNKADPTLDRSTQTPTSHRELFNSWFDDDDKANDRFTVPSRAVRGVSIFDRPAILVKFYTQESKNRFIKLCNETPNLLTKLSPNVRICPQTYPVIFKFVPCNSIFDPAHEKHLRDLEEENDLTPNSIALAEWCKKPEKRSPRQLQGQLPQQ